MENFLESNERTLVIFDSVCLGLTQCLALVHDDIKQMTEHRSYLVAQQKEFELELATAGSSSSGRSGWHSSQRGSAQRKSLERIGPTVADNKWREHRTKATKTNKLLVEEQTAGHQNEEDDDDDPHHLARLKLLDKRLADTFSQAMSMCDLPKSTSLVSRRSNEYGGGSINARGIFNLLLGKTRLNKSKRSNSTRHGLDRSEPIESEQEQRLAIIDDISKQTRLAQQYSKQLEAHLLKVEDLRARYEMHLKMSQVVKDMSRPYTASTLDWHSNSLKRRSKNRARAAQLAAASTASSKPNQPQTIVTNTKATTKDYVENIQRLEAEFEPYMGSFMLNIEDVQGFARVCQGDVFEVSIKYGDSQKFKTRISVLKDNRQKCDNRQAVFKVKIADVIAVKAYECKALGKKILLGNKLCETRDLFTAQSQLMTISLNQTGSIKLNLIITWNPLHLDQSSSLESPIPRK